jgi:hypothetical protein
MAARQRVHTHWPPVSHPYLSRVILLISNARRATFSYLRSLRSVFDIHNESVNIWSHILGAAAFLCTLSFLYLSFSRWGSSDDDENTADTTAVVTYFVSVIACFVLSFMQVQTFSLRPHQHIQRKIRTLTIKQLPHLPRPQRAHPHTNMPLRLSRHRNSPLGHHSLQHSLRLPL